jgi:hypothetical protein
MRRLLSLAAIIPLLLLAGACGGTAEQGPSVRLDGSPRPPTDQGVVTAVSRSSLTLDAKRTYRLTPRLQSFSTSTLTVASILQRKGQYVEVGAHGRTIGWVATVAAVLPTNPPAVYYQGTLLRVVGNQAIFRDGTIFNVKAGVRGPAKGPVLVRIDPARHVVVEMTQQGA